MTTAPRSWLIGAAIALAVLTTAWVQRVSEGRHALAAAGSAIQKGDRTEAIVLARASAEARCPFCEAPELACGLLDAIAKEAEAEGDLHTAIAAWRAIRSATMGTFGPSAARRGLADSELARLEHRMGAAAVARGGGAAAALSEEKLRDALSATTMPSGGVFAIVGAGMVLFAIGAIRFARARAFQPTALALALVGGALAAAGVLFF